MRVALDVGPLKPNPAGVGIYVRSLATALATQLDPGELVFVGRRPDAAGLPDGVRSTNRSPSLRYPAWALLRAGAAARRVQADLVHMTDGLVPVISRPGRVVVTVLDLTMAERWRDHRPLRYPRIPFVLAAPRMAHSVIVPSRATADAVMRLTGTRASRIHVVPLAARSFAPFDHGDVEAAALRHGLVPGRFFLVPGTIEPRKNPYGCLRAFEFLLSRGEVAPDTRLAFAGSPGWGVRPFIDALASSSARDLVIRLGYVDDADMAPLMAGSAAVVYPSFAEGFGLPVLEAMACGAIVVTSDRSSLPEVAGDAAFLVDPNDEAAIAGAMRDAMDLSPGARESVSAAAVARAGQFSWTRTAEGTMEAYG